MRVALPTIMDQILTSFRTYKERPGTRINVNAALRVKPLNNWPAGWGIAPRKRQRSMETGRAAQQATWITSDVSLT